MTPPPSSPTHPHHPISILNPLPLELLDQSKNLRVPLLRPISAAEKNLINCCFGFKPTTSFICHCHSATATAFHNQ